MPELPNYVWVNGYSLFFTVKIETKVYHQKMLKVENPAATATKITLTYNSNLLIFNCTMVDDLLLFGNNVSSISFTTSAKSHSSDDGFEIDATISKQ